MRHVLKIQSQFVEPILSGNKIFEVRKNDRGFQKGDTVNFQVVQLGLPHYESIQREEGTEADNEQK